MENLFAKEDIQTGDLIFFKTGRGPNGYHVGIYVKEDKFLHALNQRWRDLFFDEQPLLEESLLAS